VVCFFLVLVKDQVVHDATQVVGNNGASSTMMGLYDI
jgi:hypothetical protein